MIVFFTVPAALRIISRPTPVEPVNVTMSIAGCRTIRSATPTELAVMTLKTPGGISVSSATIWPAKAAVHGVSGDGLVTTVLPAARAGTVLITRLCSG